MKDKLPKLNSKEAEKLLFENGFILDRQKGSHRIAAIEYIKKKAKEWLYRFIAGKFCIQKS